MITIKLIEGHGENERELRWRLKDTLEEKEFDPLDVIEVTAEGEELKFLVGNFHNLLHHPGNLNAWYGGTAQSIASRIYQLGRKNERYPRTAA